MDNEIRLGYYRKEDWDKHVASADDPEKLHSNWDNWLKSFIEVKTTLELEGNKVQVVTIEIDQLLQYCKDKKIKNTGTARSQYVMETGLNEGLAKAMKEGRTGKFIDTNEFLKGLK